MTTLDADTGPAARSRRYNASPKGREQRRKYAATPEAREKAHEAQPRY
jgi:hypothetical protein